MKIDHLKKENKSTLLSKNYHKHTDKLTDLEKKKIKWGKNCRQECIEIAGIPLSISKNLLERKVLLIVSKLGVNNDKLDIITCYRLDSADRTIIKLLNGQDAVKLLEKKNKLKYVGLYKNSSEKNDDNNLYGDQVNVFEQVF